MVLKRQPKRKRAPFPRQEPLLNAYGGLAATAFGPVNSATALTLTALSPTANPELFFCPSVATPPATGAHLTPEQPLSERQPIGA